MLPKNSIYGFISESFAFNWCIFITLTNKKLLLPLLCELSTNLFSDSVKLIQCLASAVIAVSFNLCVGTSPRTKIYFYLDHQSNLKRKYCPFQEDF